MPRDWKPRRFGTVRVYWPDSPFYDREGTVLSNHADGTTTIQMLDGTRLRLLTYVLRELRRRDGTPVPLGVS